MSKLEQTAKKLARAAKKASNFKGGMTFELNSAGVRELLKSDGVRDTVKHYADEIASQCGEGYDSDTKMEQTRVIASAYTSTPETMVTERDDNKLLHALSNVKKD